MILDYLALISVLITIGIVGFVIWAALIAVIEMVKDRSER